MTYNVYFVCSVLIQFSSAQVLSYVQRNTIPQQAVESAARYVSNVANTYNNALQNPSNTVTIARVPTAVPVASNAVVTNANAISSSNNANLVNANIVNAAANQNVASNNYATNQNLANANYAVNYANTAGQNTGNVLASNGVNYANAYANPNVAYVSNTAAPATATVATVANNIANVNNAVVASPGHGNINGNVATFNLGTNGNTFTVTSGSPGAPGFGISVIADALEVGGTVAVNGQIPIFGSVAVNGNVPTDGAATVTYNCNGKQVPATV